MISLTVSRLMPYLDLPYVLFLEEMSSFLMKNNLSSEHIKKCPNVLLSDILNSENMSNHASRVQMYHHIFICWRNTKILGRFRSGLVKLRPADMMTLFFVLRLILSGKLDICTLQ